MFHLHSSILLSMLTSLLEIVDFRCQMQSWTLIMDNRISTQNVLNSFALVVILRIVAYILN